VPDGLAGLITRRPASGLAAWAARTPVLSLFDAGGRVAISAPGYPAYRSVLQAVDLEPVGRR
jgi:aspartate/methionine/tyrosine aminotransferase